MDEDTRSRLFAVFNEIGILAQLSRAMLETKLPKGLVAPHFHVLNHLVRVRDGQTPQRIAAAFQVPKTSMTHTLAGLEKSGLVDMRPNPKDGRSKQVWLTDAGRRLRDDTIRAMGPEFEQMASKIAPDRLIDCLPALTELRKILDAQRDA